MASLLAAIPAFIKSLPYLIQILVRFMTIVERVADYVQKQNIEKWLDDVEQNIDKLENAKTSEQKLAAARDLSNLLRKL